MALRPYSRERYIKNFTMMTTVDQAPKIAHLGSVLEVVNKSESLKETLMMVAGSVVEPQMKWGNFSKGGEALRNATHIMRTLRGYIKGICSDGFESSITKRRH